MRARGFARAALPPPRLSAVTDQVGEGRQAQPWQGTGGKGGQSIEPAVISGHDLDAGRRDLPVEVRGLPQFAREPPGVLREQDIGMAVPHQVQGDRETRPAGCRAGMPIAGADHGHVPAFGLGEGAAEPYLNIKVTIKESPPG